MKDSTLWYGLGFFVVVFMTLVIIGGVRHGKENNIVKDQCEPTELYIIGNKSFRTRVYDCNNVDIK